VKSHFLLPLVKGPSGPLRLINDRTGLTVARELEAAFDSASRNRGLLGRDGLPPGHALVIAPGTLIHTFFMRFAIDILFVSREGRVLKVCHSVPARRIAGAWRSFAAIEMAGGEVGRSDTRAGDLLKVVSTDTL
jgi:uncharacterized membrane protein (UPF0127 family)